mmetsp:Transcript_21608/g.47012  ORF Transcript_21608/g.47012 Transcript_21608/m.47012 type:complete len:690 (-) Transcript_21608:222-2291(-)
MGFFKKSSASSSYPARRNRINQQQSHPATVNPPSNYGAHNPQPLPASIYQANGMTVAPAQHAATATTTAATYNASSYGAFPDNSAPVQATAYMPGQGAAVAATAAHPVQATAYIPGSAPAAVQAAVYNPNAHTVASTPQACAYGAASPPATNPLYSNQQPSFNNGNSTYKTDESSFWECVVCTFPNLRTEASCKGCGSPCPPGMLYSAASAASAHQHPPQNPTNGMHSMNTQMNNLSMGGAGGTGNSSGGSAGGVASGVMRVHIPSGMQPGQKIKVRSPDGNEVVKTIPPQSQWHYDNNTKPFFRMQFGSSAAAAPAIQGALMAHEVPSPHTTAWRDFYTHAPARLPKPPLGALSIPHSPRGGAGIPPNGRHKALIIGINYHRTNAELRGCINDAKNMQTLLQRNGFPNDGSHMLLLTDEKNRGREYQPTVQNIMKAFSWFMKDVRRGDILFFHFSGHGGQVPDKTGHEVDGYNETIIPLDYQRNGQITDDVLWGGLVYNLPEGARITALMDMCHSGTGLDLPYDYNVNTRQWKEDINPAHSAGDVVLFSGCEDAQTSADVSGGHGSMAGGAMTQAFMKAYESTAAMSTYHEFLDEVKKQLRKKRFSQRPQLTSSQQFDTNTRIFSLGYQSASGGIPSVIEPNHNPKVGRMKRRHVRPAREGFRGGGGSDLFGLAGAAVGAALFADAFF